MLKRIEEAKYYCVLFDETTDISHSSQLTLCVSYGYQNSRHEDFLVFTMFTIPVLKVCHRLTNQR